MFSLRDLYGYFTTKIRADKLSIQQETDWSGEESEGTLGRDDKIMHSRYVNSLFYVLN
jgi:hypothetical protein